MQTLIPLYCLQTLGGAMVAVVIRILDDMNVDVALVDIPLVAAIGIDASKKLYFNQKMDSIKQ